MFVIDDYLCIRCKKCLKTCSEVAGAISEVDKKLEIDQSKCIGCGECIKNCPVKGAIKGIYINNVEEQKEIINLVVDTLEAKIEAEQDKIKKLEPEEIYKIDFPISDLLKKAREIIPNDELIRDSIEKITDRLKMRIVTWDDEKCNNCRLCTAECPSGAITYDKEKGVQRDPDKCLRCSICYQTCPFGVAGFYVARFLLTDATIQEGMIQITLKPSQLPIRS
jgi:energy-converting hydrogenase A subunit P